VLAGIAVLVVGALAGAGVALATRDSDDDSSSPSTTSSSTTTSSSSTTSSTTTTTSSTTTSTTVPTTTTSTTLAAPRIVSFTGPPEASCPAQTVTLSWSTQHASGTLLSVDGDTPSVQAAAGSTAAPFDCDADSQTYTLTTTGGSPAATQAVSVTNNLQEDDD
jgi:hypothetical protein